MSNVNQLQRQFTAYCRYLHREGYLDDQFTELRRQQDEKNPDFVAGIVSVFFELAQNAFKDLARALEQEQGVDFNQIGARVKQLRESSSGIGAVRVANACTTLLRSCEAQNREECLKYLQKVTEEYSILKNQLELLLGIGADIRAAGGTIPGVD